MTPNQKLVAGLSLILGPLLAYSIVRACVGGARWWVGVAIFLAALAFLVVFIFGISLIAEGVAL